MIGNVVTPHGSDAAAESERGRVTLARTRRLLRRLLVVGGTAVIALLSGCGTPKASEAIPRGEPMPAEKRENAPALAGATLTTGRMWSLAAQRGKVVVVNFWGSWCGPCRAEAAVLVEAARRSAPLGVTFIGVNERDNRPAARSFIRTYKITYPSLYDNDGTISAEWPASRSVPYTFVIDRQGRIAARFIGGVVVDELLKTVSRIAAER